MINLARKEGALLPQGTLRCTSSNGTDQYFVDGNYISKKKLEIVRGDYDATGLLKYKEIKEVLINA